MSQSLSICIEHLDAVDPNERYLRCVAMPGRGPGLRLGAGGEVLWRSDEGASCELWTSADGRLALYRLEHGSRVVVSRAGRSIEAPAGKPVMLLHGDELEVGGRRLRVHVHGRAPQAEPPEPVVVERNRRAFRAAATAVIVGATLVSGMAAAQSSGPIEVRERPPAPPPPPPRPDAAPDVDDTEVTDPADPRFALPPDDESDPEGGDEAVDEVADAGVEPPPIEVRENPPAPPPPPPPAAGCCARQPGSEVAWRPWRKKEH